ncbi:MAG TPA: MMPL family transporter [Thermomicrobiaceae bacterium]|nr:MMPL family transporter [Thermomicrobiaceae bacterium]
MFARLGRVVVHHPWMVIIGWIIAAVLIISFAPKLTTTSDEASFLPSHYQSIQAQNLQQKAFPDAAAPAAIIVFERADGKPLTSQDSAKVASIGKTLTARHIDDVSFLQVSPPPPNKLIQTIAVVMPPAKGPADQSQADAVKSLRANLSPLLSNTDLKGGITGNAAQQLDSQQASNRADTIVAASTILLILVLLLLIFRSPIIALLPIIVIGIISQMATGLIGWANQAFNLNTDSTVSAMLIVVLFGVGTDYILFLLFRYREQIRAGEDSKAAMVSAVTRVGEAIASAASAVIIAFLALTLSSLSLFRSLGPALAIAVATTLVAGLTLIPAIVSLLGTRVFWPSKAWQNEPEGARFKAMGDAMGRHPGRFALVSGAFLVVLAIVALGFRPTFDLGSGSTATSESAVYQAVLLKSLPAGVTEPSDVLVQSTNGQTLPATELAQYRSRLAAVKGVGEVGPPQLSANKQVADYQVILSAPGTSDTAINTLRGPLQQVASDAAPPNSRVLIGGITSVFADLNTAMDHDYSIVFPVAAALILVILGLLLRSIVAPWYLMLSVGLGFASTLGATVAIFQYGTGNSGLIFILPIIMYLFVVALGTDYNIFMISRLREEAAGGRSSGEAAAIAVRHAGPTIASAGVILAGTFASLMIAGGSTLVQMGFAISFGIVVAAFVMAMFFTPALTALIGPRAWWPGHAGWRHAQGAPEPEAKVVTSAR